MIKTIVIRLMILVAGFNLSHQVAQQKLVDLGIKKPRVEYYFINSIVFTDFINAVLNNLIKGFTHADRSIYHFVQSPWYDFNLNSYVGGLAPVCYRKQKNGGHVSMSAWKTDSPDRLRTPHSQVAILHEIAHQLGALHDDSNCNIMHPDAANCFNKEFCQTPETCDVNNFLWNKKAKQEVKRCLNVAVIKRRKNIFGLN